MYKSKGYKGNYSSHRFRSTHRGGKTSLGLKYDSMSIMGMHKKIIKSSKWYRGYGYGSLRGHLTKVKHIHTEPIGYIRDTKMFRPINRVTVERPMSTVAHRL